MPRRGDLPLGHAARPGRPVAAERADRARPGVAGCGSQGVRHGAGLPPPPPSPGALAAPSSALLHSAEQLHRHGA
uniref:Uncharacterized protein n=1 Tax=Arundo donax TaxID=35708 RepID=A0A0A9G023_ARUDO